MGNDNSKVQALNCGFRDAASEAARRAGELLIREFLNPRQINYKGRIDLVTEMDRASEELIIKFLSEKFPGHEILAEEGGSQGGPSEYRWLIDPLDGTTNYAHGFPFFCVSIGLEDKKSGIISAAVYAPYMKEMYTAARGCGAELNGSEIKVSGISALDKALLGTGFPYNIKETGKNIEYFEKFLYKAQAVRRPGSAALDLCAVASGRFDGFWEIDLNPWDTAAGMLIVEESGGRVTGFGEEPYTPYDRRILATNGLIHGEMSGVLG